ncbi:MAG: hypothetical protein EOP51_11800 [Sphingobacteriales bacterium]|nr:MAG: hypothetical protein EOP51_11800 [Sphingobacteriales bacterium]
MKQKLLFTFLLLGTVILTSCRKDRVFPDIKQYDAEQIQKYIAANGLTQMRPDTSAGDTSGIYYQILNQGDTTAARIEYSDRLAMVYTLNSFDGKYKSADTILNHYSGYLGQFSSLGLPKGLQSAIYNILKYKGGSMRLLIPSRLAYGKGGFGSGSSGNTTGRIAGNQCLDYFVRIVADQPAYDDLAITKYMAANSITEHVLDPRGFYYKITGLDTGALVTGTSKITATYKVQYLNNTVVDSGTDSGFDVETGVIPGVKEALKLTRVGQTISFLLPSRWGYGQLANDKGVPAFTCLRFEFTVKTSVNY